jgi:exodeoxyribonuclease-5
MTEAQTIIPTKDQEVLIQKIEKFLKSDDKYFLLIGPAGSGKTTAIKLALEEQINKNQVMGITLAHKAKNVLQKASIPECRTFASAYAFKETILDDGTRVFAPNPFPVEPPVGHLDIPVFVHDEVSMYSESMKKIVFQKTSMFSKVIFMGDNAQLPPIDASMKVDADSPIFDLELPESCKHVLTERVRQKAGNPILDLSDIIREEIFGNQNINRVIMEILNPKIFDGKGYLCISEKDLYPQYIEKENFLYNKIIAFRNFRIEQMNKRIRSSVFPNETQKLVVDDLVFMTNNFKNEKPPFRLNNSEEFIIKEVVQDKILHQHGHPIETYFGRINDSFNDGYIITPTEKGITQYNKIVTDLKNYAKQNPKLWRQFYNFTDLFTDYTMGYAINTYRCQGSTYEDVYIDLNDILQTGPLTTKRKLQSIYTSLTRAKNIAYFIKP